MENYDADKILKECQRFVNRNYSMTLKDQLSELTDAVSSDEMPDFYGSGKLIDDFENEIACILGKPKSLFMPSGTMAQVLALRVWSDFSKNSHFGMHPTSHLEIHEKKAYLHLHQLNGHLLGEFDRVISLVDIKNSPVKLSSVIIELPQRENGGLLPEWDELSAISNWCRNHDIKLHLDGARLWESGPFYQRKYNEICELFDSVYVSFYKGLGGIGGAVLSGPDALISEVKIWQRRQGGNLVTLFPFVVSARKSLSRLDKMDTYYKKAKEIALMLSGIKNIKVVPQVPQTNMMHIFFEGNIEKIENASLKIAKEKKIWVFRKLQPTSNPLVGKFELSVGDALLDISKEEIYEIFKSIAEN